MTTFILKPRPSGSCKPNGSQSLTGEAGLFDSIRTLFSGCEMWTDPEYLRSWRDLRRRDFLFWFFLDDLLKGRVHRLAPHPKAREPRRIEIAGELTSANLILHGHVSSH